MGLETVPEIKVNYIGGPTLAFHLPHQGYGTVGCTQMVYLVLLTELVVYYYPQNCREVGWHLVKLQAITIQFLMVHFPIQAAHLIVFKHLGAGHHQCKSLKQEKLQPLQLEQEEGLRRLHILSPSRGIL